MVVKYINGLDERSAKPDRDLSTDEEVWRGLRFGSVE